MIFELIRVSSIYVTLAYSGDCSEVRESEIHLPYAVDKRYAAIDKERYCEIQYQANVPDQFKDYDMYRANDYLRQFVIRNKYMKRPRMDLYDVKYRYLGILRLD